MPLKSSRMDSFIFLLRNSALKLFAKNVPHLLNIAVVSMQDCGTVNLNQGDYLGKLSFHFS